MSDWTVDLVEYGPIGVLSTANETSLAADLIIGAGDVIQTSAVWPTASLAMFFPVMVKTPTTIYGFGWYNGATVSGNVDVGLYDAEYNRLGSVGGVAQSGTTAIQTASVSSFSIPIGRYYLGHVMDNTTGTNHNSSTGAPVGTLLRALGCFQQTSAYPLPNPAVPATFAQTIVTSCCAFMNGSTF